MEIRWNARGLQKSFETSTHTPLKECSLGDSKYNLTLLNTGGTNGKINYAGLTGNVKTDKSILNWCR